ncbi:3-deoxy-D-manno-octulosonic acid transferase [Sphingobacterium sp. UT-1RO-CII-1]|uniref:3-deoxy-D-manno-octulosonic acid transferase n=1 Tax=Sphingobacterium sp. UT-1RO-CII-1 TaxID=2995225 RepID=UPI00227BF8FF|nr:glycosyltransferase N-terminal domain-containing protein [Sphingobacterium sp. UT-1RO-CII-1]MCY4780965.1 3-deoxy-D-manno-octulosonic acid transferase [Sphingobacterium sp. UT-1RO-CII-1]
MRVLYDIGIGLYTLILRLISPFHTKARLWVKGRRGLFDEIEQTIEKGCKPVWFHFASLGEFEQGRSVMEAIKREFPAQKILITFFSPSGYEVRKNTNLADYVFYLPIDTRRNAERFLAIVEPKFVVFTKYEYWYHYFNVLHKNGTVLLLISAIFREDQIFFKWYGGFFRGVLKKVSFFFTQNSESVLWLKAINITRAGLAGDTRFDRVIDLPNERQSLPIIECFLKNSVNTLVAGSTWLPDEKILASFVDNSRKWKLILAPHEIHESHLLEIKKLFGGVLFYSKALTYTSDELEEASVLVIDNFGLLSSLYGYGHVTYVGGGFGVGIHNTLEAATYGLPVLFGPRYTKFREAVELIEYGAALSIDSQRDFNRIMAVFDDINKVEEMGEIARKYVVQNAGATKVIMKYIVTQRLLEI